MLYVTGEESSATGCVTREQDWAIGNLPVSVIVAENHLESILDQIPNYEFLVIDSIQSLYSDNVSVITRQCITQVRESAERLTQVREGEQLLGFVYRPCY